MAAAPATLMSTVARQMAAVASSSSPSTVAATRGARTSPTALGMYQTASASSVATLGGIGKRRTLIFVIAQSVPSDPTSTPQRSRPTRSGASPLTHCTLPSASTTSIPSTWLVVTP